MCLRACMLIGRYFRRHPIVVSSPVLLQLTSYLSYYQQRQELEKMNRSLMNDVQRMRRNDQTVCKHGIEHMASPEIHRAMRQEKEGVILAVISEQKRQRMLGIHDPQLIALTSKENSAGAKIVAQFLAGK